MGHGGQQLVCPAQPLNTPAEIVGTINSPDDASDTDYFSLNLLAGQTVYAFLLADTLDSPAGRLAGAV